MKYIFVFCLLAGQAKAQKIDSLVSEINNIVRSTKGNNLDSFSVDRYGTLVYTYFGITCKFNLIDLESISRDTAHTGLFFSCEGEHCVSCGKSNIATAFVPIIGEKTALTLIKRLTALKSIVESHSK